MRIFLPIIIIMIIFGVNGLLIAKTISSVLLRPVQAEEYTALDFASSCDDFYVTVGISKENGRYAKYSYEFTE